MYLIGYSVSSARYVPSRNPHRGHRGATSRVSRVAEQPGQRQSRGGSQSQALTSGAPSRRMRLACATALGETAASAAASATVLVICKFADRFAPSPLVAVACRAANAARWRELGAPIVAATPLRGASAYRGGYQGIPRDESPAGACLSACWRALRRACRVSAALRRRIGRRAVHAAFARPMMASRRTRTSCLVTGWPRRASGAPCPRRACPRRRRCGRRASRRRGCPRADVL